MDRHADGPRGNAGDPGEESRFHHVIDGGFAAEEFVRDIAKRVHLARATRLFGRGNRAGAPCLDARLVGVIR